MNQPVIAVDPAALERDPYPVYDAIRLQGGRAWIEPLGLWYVVGYDDVRAVLSDTQRFVVGTDHSLILDLFGTNMLTLEGAAHTRARSAFRGPFAPASIRSAMSGRIATVVDQLLSELPAKQDVDLRQHFASRLPVLSILVLFGLSPDTEPQVRGWYDIFEKAIANFARDADVRAAGQRAAAEFRGFFAEQIERARGMKTDGLLGEALNAPYEDRLSDDEIISNALLIFFGGISTVEALLLNTLYAAALHDFRFIDAKRTAAAIEETMRWLSPVQSATRHISTATGPFAAGDTVNAMLGAANRDPAIFAEPGKWRPDRANRGHHLGFAAGAHFCLGSHLARLEVATAVQRLFARFPDTTIAEPHRVEIMGSEFRQPRVLRATLR